jgi:hypothetical protein
VLSLNRSGDENNMPKERKTSGPQPPLKYRRVQITNLSRKRRGKHHDLVDDICRELEMLPPGAALEIPLSGVGEIGLANLRSAVHRATQSRDIPIETLADKENFYVWRRGGAE